MDGSDIAVDRLFGRTHSTPRSTRTFEASAAPSPAARSMRFKSGSRKSRVEAGTGVCSQTKPRRPDHFFFIVYSVPTRTVKESFQFFGETVGGAPGMLRVRLLKLDQPTQFPSTSISHSGMGSKAMPRARVWGRVRLVLPP